MIPAETLQKARRKSLADRVDTLSEAECNHLLHDWETIGRSDQQPPEGKWQIWLFMAGRGAGKTRAGVEWIRKKVITGSRHIGLIARTAADARDVMVDGESGILAKAWRYDVDVFGRQVGVPVYESSKRRLIWANGAVAHTYSAEEPDRLRGPQHDCYVAGTLIETPHGPRSIETISPWSRVWTRQGLRTVTAARNRMAQVCTVRFASGAELTGTLDHPVAVEGGWQTLSTLRPGDKVVACVILASNMEAGAGTVMPAAITNIAARVRLSARTVIACIVSSGAMLMEQYQRALTFITKTMIAATMPSTILSFFPTASTSRCISPPRHFAAIGASNRSSKSRAPIAAVNLSDGNVQLTPDVVVATTGKQIGVARVYNLMVEEPHEYVANGIVVHNCLWADELAFWRMPVNETRHNNAWDMAMFGLRIGRNPQAMISTTPKPIPLLRDLIKRSGGRHPTVALTTATTYDNRSNLAESFFDKIIRKYEGSRLGQQELLGRLIEESEGALWTREMLDKAHDGRRPDMARVVVAVDPAVSATATSALTGIVVCGLGVDRRGYILADLSGRYTPDGWARRVATAYDDYAADRVVAEGNQGGDLVRVNLETARKGLPISIVHASRSKQARAEPVAALFEQRRVTIVDGEDFSELESQLCTWEPLSGDASPDRLDAMVWGMTELMLNNYNDMIWVPPIVTGAQRNIPGQ